MLIFSSVDWEYPEPGQQSENFVELFSVLRAYFPRPRYIVTTALPAAKWCLERFQLHRLASRIDFLNLMGYDFVGNWGQPIVSGHHG
jgi:chitinase